jgi:tetratricopeptide (TPR) repeat protein
VKLICLLLLLVTLTWRVDAQRHRLEAVNAQTPDGKILQQIGQESDTAKKIALMEQFTAEFPKSDATGWVLSQMQAAYIKQNAFDKGIQTGEKLLASDPDDIDAAYGNLKASEGKKDSAGILKWSAETSKIARRAVQAPKPTSAGEQEAWTQAVDYAKQVDTYTEYAVYALALQLADPAAVMDAVETLEKRNPQSQYIVQLLGRYAGAARQSNALNRAVAIGERAYGRGQLDEDMLLAMADSSMQKKQPDKVILYTAKVVEMMPSKGKPEGITDTAWETKRATVTGLANWMAGVTFSGQEKYADADKSLRAALPSIKDDQLRGAALFHLGVANYKMGRTTKNKTQIADALKFSEQSAGIKSAYQAQSAKNVLAIKKEFALK